MKHFYIIPNRSKDVNLEIANEIKREFESKSEKVSVVICDSAQYGKELHRCIPADTECILVLGGDGTLLQTAKETVHLGIPLLGINLGTLGYLAEVEPAGIPTAAEQLIADRYVIEERMMLQGSVIKGGICAKEDIALNDVVLSRRGDLQIVGYRVYVNGLFLNDFYADGIIISTPTGSTGYNLSAGGSIVEPKANLMVLTPVCPHTLNTRSIMLSPEDNVEVELLPPKGEKQVEVGVYFDGGSCEILEAGNRVAVSRSKEVTKILKLSDVGFLEVLQKKMSE